MEVKFAHRPLHWNLIPVLAALGAAILVGITASPAINRRRSGSAQAAVLG